MMKIIHFVSCVMLLGSAFSSEPSKRERLSSWIKQKKEDIKTTKIDLKSSFTSDPSRQYFYQLAVKFRQSKSQTISPEKPRYSQDYYDLHLPDDINSLFDGAKVFDGKDCNITGPIPANLFELNTLTRIDLSKNNLSGDIPSNIGNLSSLEVLNVSDNQLIGSLPESIGDLISLKNLNVSDNQLIGSLPETIGSLISLENLNVSSNQLTGPLPEIMHELISLEKLNVSNNQITGMFSLARYAPFTKMINLENNLFTDIDFRTSQSDGDTDSTVIPKVALSGNPIQNFQCNEVSQEFELIPDAAGTHVHIDPSLFQDKESTQHVLGAFLKNPTNKFPFQIGFYTQAGSAVPDYLKNKGFQGNELITLDLHHRDEVVLNNLDGTQKKGTKSHVLVYYRNTKNQSDAKFNDFLKNQLEALQSPTYDIKLLTEAFPGHSLEEYHAIQNIIRTQPFNLEAKDIEQKFRAANKLNFPIDINITVKNATMPPRQIVAIIEDPLYVRSVTVDAEKIISPILGEIFAYMDHYQEYEYNSDRKPKSSIPPEPTVDRNGDPYENSIEAKVDSIFQKFPQINNAPIKTFFLNRLRAEDGSPRIGTPHPSHNKLYMYVLKRMPDLEDLSFKGGSLGSGSIEQFAPYLAKMKNLVSLNLSRCRLFFASWKGLGYAVHPEIIPASWDTIQSIASNFGKLTHLETLDLSRNDITDEQLEVLVPAFRNMKNLKKLDLSGNKFTPKAQAIMKDVLEQNPDLQCTL